MFQRPSRRAHGVSRTGRRICLAFLSFMVLAFATRATAQIRVGLKFEHSATLRFEPVRLFITVYNDSSQPLVIDGEETSNLSLAVVIERRTDDVLKPTTDQPLCSNLQVPVNDHETIMSELTGRFDLTDIGTYAVTVEARWEGLVFRSGPASLDVVEGLTIATVDRHVGGYPDRLRRYTLRYWKRNHAEHLFLRIDEPSRFLTYGVFDLGRLIRVTKPQIEVQPDGKVTVLHQLGKDCFKRSIFQSDSAEVSLVDQSYHLPDGSPYPNLRRIRPTD